MSHGQGQAQTLQFRRSSPTRSGERLLGLSQLLLEKLPSQPRLGWHCFLLSGAGHEQPAKILPCWLWVPPAKQPPLTTLPNKKATEKNRASWSCFLPFWRNSPSAALDNIIIVCSTVVRLQIWPKIQAYFVFSTFLICQCRLVLLTRGESYFCAVAKILLALADWSDSSCQ